MTETKIVLPAESGMPECAQILESALAVARRGKIVQVAISTVEIADDGTLCTKGYWCAPQRMQHELIKSIGYVHKTLSEFTENCSLSDRDPTIGADHVVWNVQMDPHSYDFIPWLVTREMARIRAGAPAPLKVHFWYGRDGKCPDHAFVSNVMKPALDLIGAVEDEADVGGLSHEVFTLHEVSEAVRGGERPPLLRAPEYAREIVREFLGGLQPVVITLREKDKWPERNSSLDAWAKFAGELERTRPVLFVRDTAMADVPMPIGLASFPEASKNLHIRMALYEAASINMFVGNGPASLAWFAERPWLMFVPLGKDGDRYWANTPTFWRVMQGVEPPGQYPWSRSDQRIIWGMDDYDTIKAAWDALMPRITAKAA